LTLVGVIGGGQLGLLLGQAAERMDVECRFLDPAADACAGDVGELVVGAYDDPDALRRLAAGADVVTYEFENVPLDAALLVDAVPGVRALEEGQDRLREKELFRRLGIPTARFGGLDETGVPAIVKSRRLGYDGKGQRRVAAPGPIGDDELAEELLQFDRELSIVAVRGRNGDTRFWPVTENLHRGGILRVSRVPALGAPQVEAEAIATRLLDELGYVGVLAVELFDVGGTLVANEFAPRVHNSGHWTIDGARTSQFENHLRAILGLGLGATDAVGAAVMVNLIGGIPSADQLAAIPGLRVHLYGKEPRPGRKVGHLTLIDADEASVASAVALADAVADG
jgi:5-(carboxyamino)imidazole ribonucleotide synthase